MGDDRFIIKNSGTILIGEGRDFYQRFVQNYYLYFFNQREVLSSVFNEQNQSTAYALQLRARARELARMRVFMEEVYADLSLSTTRSAFLYRTFGSYLQIDEPFFFTDKSDLFYRRFIKSFLNILLRGATKQSVIDGLNIFCEGLPFEVTEGYIDPFRNIRNYNRLINFATHLDGPKQVDPRLKPDIYNKNIFYVKFKVDQRQPGTDLDFIYQGVDFFLDIIKPAHNAYYIKWFFEDTFRLAANCQLEYDLILDEKIADSIQKDSAGITISSINKNIITVSDGTKLFVTNDTDLLDETETEILYSSFSVGDKILYTSHNTQGRFKYSRPLEDLPPSLLYSYVGYISAPLVEDISETLLMSNIFQMYVVKQLDASGMEKETKTEGICDTKKDRIYTWYYDDFRKCGQFNEFRVELEDVKHTYSSISNTIQLKYFPITDGMGTGNLAESVTVLVDGAPAAIASIAPLTGTITLVDPVGITADIKVSYFYSKNLAYTLDENEGFLNKVTYSGTGSYANFLNSGLIDDQKKIRWKTTAFYLPGSSLLNLSYSLVENTESSNRERLNHSRLVRNYETKACKIFDRTARFGLSLDGECLNYPTPPVPLRFSVDAKLPDPWKILEGSDVLNKLNENLNDPKDSKNLTSLLLNNVFRKLVFGPYDKRYSFIDVDKSDCGGSLTFYPFCDDPALRIGLRIRDEFERLIVPEIDYIRLNNEDYVENEHLLYGVSYTGVIFKVQVKWNTIEHQEDIPIFKEELDTQVNINNILQDKYKNSPLNIIIENDAVTSPDPGTPIYGFDPNSNIINLPLLNNENGDILNDTSIVQIGTEYGPDLIDIPPSRVFPGDGIDVVPHELKNSPEDTNYVFTARRTFDESVFCNIEALFDDVYQFPTERYVLNNPPYGLNQIPFILNASTERLQLN